MHSKFGLLPETLFLAINLTDRYLEKQSVPRNALQLVGVSALFLACKYEEIYAPVAHDFVVASDRAYTKEQIISTERNILKVLDFRISIPNPYRFILKWVNRNEERLLNLSRYMAELALLDYKMIRFPPSQIAVSSVFLSNKILKLSQVIPDSPYSEIELKTCAKELCILAQAAKKSPLQATYKKFCSDKYLGVSLLL